MKRLIVITVLAALAMSALFVMRAAAEAAEPRRGGFAAVQYGLLIEGLPGENKVCWQNTDGVMAARDWDALTDRLGGQRIPGAPLAAVFNAVGLTGWHLVLVQKPNMGDTMWVFSR
jgi:hypothetical protein